MFTYHCYTCMSCLHITVTYACHVFTSLLHLPYMFHVTVFMLYACFPLLILLPPLLDTWAVDMRYVDSHIYCFPFPVIVFRTINRAHVMLSYYMYHILYLFLIYCIMKDNNDNVGMGETWRLIRSYRVDVWIHCTSHCRGRGSAGYHLLLMLHVTALAGWPWSQQPGVCLRPLSRVCTGYTHPIRAPRPWVSN